MVEGKRGKAGMPLACPSPDPHSLAIGWGEGRVRGTQAALSGGSEAEGDADLETVHLAQ